MQSEINSLKEINLKLLTKITEFKKENAEVKAENVKLKYALEKHEVRFTSLEQRDEEKTTLITKLDDNIKEIKQSSTSTNSVENSDIWGAISRKGGNPFFLLNLVIKLILITLLRSAMTAPHII